MARLCVRATPRSHVTAIEGLGPDGVLHVRTQAPAAGGEANRAVRRLLADALGIPTRDVVLVSGAASRRKVYEVALEWEEIVARLTTS